MSQYRLLFDLAVHHEYFGGGVCRDLDIMPTEATRQRMDATGLLWRSVPGSLNVLFNSGDTATLLSRIDDSSEELKLCFYLVSKDPAFPNYSDLPPAEGDAVYCFSNQGHHPNAEGMMLLHSGDFASPDDLTQRGSLPEEGCFSGELLLDPLCLVLVINIDHTFADNTGSLVCNHYRLALNARKTYWKYYLLHGFADKDLIIKNLSNGRGTEFEEENNSPVLLNNQSAVVFRSKEVIQLQDRYQLQFQLRERSDAGEKILLKRLPLAGSGRLHREEINGKPEFVSEMYINC